MDPLFQQLLTVHVNKSKILHEQEKFRKNKSITKPQTRSVKTQTEVPNKTSYNKTSYNKTSYNNQVRTCIKIAMVVLGAFMFKEHMFKNKNV